MKRARRFGACPIESGRHKGKLHVATKQYQQFLGELFYLTDYLNRRLLPKDPEEVAILDLLSNLENLLEQESEVLIDCRATESADPDEEAFCERIIGGYVSFKSKCDWLLARDLITQDHWDVMDEIRRLRNEHVHGRPGVGRRHYKYRGHPLLTLQSLRRMFVEVEVVLRFLRRESGRRSQWATVPPGYPEELHWPDEYIRILRGH